MPVPAGAIDDYVVYVGFDTMARRRRSRLRGASRRQSRRQTEAELITSL